MSKTAAAPTEDPSATPVPAPAPVPSGYKGARYTFFFPKDSRLFANDPISVTIVPLTLAQEIDGNKLMDRSGNAFDKAKMAIAAFDGHPASWVNGEVDAVIERCSPPVRELIMQGFLKVHMPAVKDRGDFLATMVTEV